MTRRIEFTVSDEIGEQYDEARGDVPMAAWIRRALESALRDDLGSFSTEGAGDRSASASSRASQQSTYGDGDPLDPATPMKGRREDYRAVALQRQAKLNKAKS